MSKTICDFFLCLKEELISLLKLQNMRDSAPDFIHKLLLITLMKYLLLLFCLPLSLLAQRFTKAEIARYEQQAKRVTIVRDNWGIPHIYGKTDADAVFGLLYAQCEDDFKRVEMNYIEKLGRTAELKGESALYNDLQIKLLIDTTAVSYTHLDVYKRQTLSTPTDVRLRRMMWGFFEK